MEIRDVLTRPEHLDKFPALTQAAVDFFLDHLLSLARFYPLVPSHYHLERDPKDTKYINLAIEAAADWLVSWDKDLLELSNNESPTGRDFSSKYPQLRIGTGEDFLRHLD
ncbi:hypothetical protein PLANPX_3939 [Lacipirellula parvula]|uniref:PIN domain-containing protein n=1 Tax=Lacipirellula parvula TaxID=2650471 RepID=A0A5K7XE38_9BACT|nr:hypothetical protein PLANPX_3939 [Lacipirellula parvula]